jgi:hypothetical protein
VIKGKGAETATIIGRYIERRVPESKVWICMKSLERRGEATCINNWAVAAATGVPWPPSSGICQRHPLSSPCLRPGPTTLSLTNWRFASGSSDFPAPSLRLQSPICRADGCLHYAMAVLLAENETIIDGRERLLAITLSTSLNNPPRLVSPCCS